MVARLLSLGYLVASLLFQPGLLMADPPSGHFEIFFDHTTAALWDLSGTYEEEQFGITTSLTLVQDDKGKLSGNGFSSASEAGLDIQLNFAVLGAVKGRDNLTTVNLKMKITGTANDGFDTFPIRGKVNFSFDLDSASGQLLGSAKGRVCLRGFRCAPLNEAAQFEIPPGEDGNWTLVLDVENVDGKNLTGTGSAVLSNGRSVPLALSGKYNSTSDLAKLRLKGNGSRLALQGNAVPGLFLIQTMNAKLLGQAFRQ